MIELLLQAERSLTVGQVDAAERLYWQSIENDPRNSIAVVGLARVALERGDDRTAYQFARKALEIDPDNAAAQRLVSRLREVMEHRGESAPTDPTPDLKAGSAARSTKTGPSSPTANEGPTPTLPITGAPPSTPPASAAHASAASASGASPSAASPSAAPGPGVPRPVAPVKRRRLFGRILGR